jgi:hypothetical protein
MNLYRAAICQNCRLSVLPIGAAVSRLQPVPEMYKPKNRSGEAAADRCSDGLFLGWLGPSAFARMWVSVGRTLIKCGWQRSMEGCRHGAEGSVRCDRSPAG